MRGAPLSGGTFAYSLLYEITPPPPLDVHKKFLLKDFLLYGCFLFVFFCFCFVCLFVCLAFAVTTIAFDMVLFIFITLCNDNEIIDHEDRKSFFSRIFIDLKQDNLEYFFRVIIF